MITYKEFIYKMLEKGYNLKSDKPIIINESNDMIKTFSVKTGEVGKIIELQCPNNSIISLCGTEHNGGCSNSYICNLKCFDNKDLQPFQELHHTTRLDARKHVIAEIVITKTLLQDRRLDNNKVKEWLETVNPILKLIKSDNIREHIMWMGAYPKFSEFNKTSFTLYGNQKMLFYIINPDIDVDHINFEMGVDIFEI